MRVFFRVSASSSESTAAGVSDMASAEAERERNATLSGNEQSLLRVTPNS